MSTSKPTRRRDANERNHPQGLAARTALTVLGALAVAASFALAACASTGNDGAATRSGVLDGGGAGSGGDPASGADATTGGSGAGGSGSGGSGAAGDGGGSGVASGAGDGGGATSSCKRGLGYNHELAGDLPALRQGVGWWYDWSSAPSDPAVTAAFEAAGLEYVPMIWTGPPNASLNTAAIAKAIPASARYLLGFNEPNFTNQGNLTPAQAAAAWPEVEGIADARGLALVSPAVNYCGGGCNETDPFVWLDAFFAACTGCRVDYVAFHWYANGLSALKPIVAKYESRYGKPVWLTEFAALDNTADTLANEEAYMADAVPFLESDPKVFRYSWFIGRSTTAAGNDILGSTGALTALGSRYVSYAGACPH